MKKRSEHLGFRVFGVDRYELGMLPIRTREKTVLRKGSAHPNLTEAEQMLPA